MSRVALLLVVALAACADETTLAGAPLGWGPASGTLYTPPAASSGIVGDWLECPDASCSDPSTYGMRFANDGTVSDLAITGADGSELVYCVSDPVATYTWDGTTLTITSHGYPVACAVSFADDGATLSCLEGQEHIYLIRVSGRVEGTCPIYYD